MAGIVQLLWEGHTGAVGLHDLLWTGKGVDHRLGRPVGWDKAWMMLSGVGNYFLIVGGWVDPLSARRVALAARRLGAAAGGHLRRLRRRAVAAPRRPRAAGHRRSCSSARWRAGQVLNFYSQPQDPQMQINVMPWLTVAWGLLLGALRGGRA